MFILALVLALVIIGGFVYWFHCSLFFMTFLIFYFNNIFFILITLLFLSFFFFLPFLLSHETDRVLVLRSGIRPELLRWETRVQDIGPQKNSHPQVTSIGERPPRDLHLNAKTQLHSTTSKLQCWTPHAKQLARQEHNPTISREAA